MTMPINTAVGERRKAPRRAVSQMVRLDLPDGSTPGSYPGLLVTDLSDGGARLFAQNVEIPSTFALAFADSGLRRECRMVWQIGPEVGIEFVDHPPGAKVRR